MSFLFGEKERLLLDAHRSVNALNRHLAKNFSSRAIPDIGELKWRFVWSRGIMYGCVAACVGVFGAWSYSRTTVNVPFLSAESQTPRKRMRLMNWLLTNFTSKTEDIKKGRWWTMLTSAFSHIQPYHLLGNVVTFVTYSQYLLYSGISPVQYSMAIVSTAIVGNLAWLVQQGRKEKSDGQQSRALGLSGVVMGLGAAASFAAPHARVALFGIIPMPLWALMGAYLAFDTYMVDSPTTRIGHAAHLGGAVWGAVYYGLALRGRLPLQLTWKTPPRSR